MDTWAIVLAGGQGTRLEGEARRRYGYARPKQFCDFGAGRTLLDETLDRAARLARPERTLVVTTKAHHAEAEEVLRHHPLVGRVEQPEGRGTTPAIVLPLLTILRRDLAARVVILPSDHHVADDVAFASTVNEAVASLENDLDAVLLVAAAPDGPVDGYGWVVPLNMADERWPRVLDFREKPPAAQIAALLRSGARLNTFVLAAEAWSLAHVLRRHAPAWFGALRGAIGNPRRIADVYRRLAPSDFSSTVLPRARDHLRMVPLADVGWSDIGTPDRLARVHPPEGVPLAG